MKALGVYMRGEVLWLRQLDREEAIDFDAYPPTMRYGSTDEDGNSVTSAGSSVTGQGTSAEDAQLFAIARWTDVHLARRRLIAEQIAAEGHTPLEVKRLLAYQLLIERLRAEGYTEEEVAKKLHLSRSTIRRRFKAGLDALMAALGEHVEPERLSVLSACLECARGPRVRLAAVRYRIKGGWRTSQPERVSSLCLPCLIAFNTPADTPAKVQILHRAGVQVEAVPDVDAEPLMEAA